MSATAALAILLGAAGGCGDPALRDWISHHVGGGEHGDHHGCPTPPAGVPGTFRATTGGMHEPRVGHADVLLKDARVLLVGGAAAGTFTPLASAEIYDPACDDFQQAGSMRLARVGLQATLLLDGRVLVTGGSTDDPSTEIFDPASRAFSAGPPMTKPRTLHTATLLEDGRVLVAGGQPPSEGDASAELYDPALGTFAAVGSMTVSRRGHEAILLPSGQVLVTGGPHPSSSAGSGRSEAELYSPGAGTFTATGSLAVPRNTHRLTMLRDGRVMVTGGVLGGIHAIAEVESYDPAAGDFRLAGSLQHGRWGHTATPLVDGRVLIAGGDGSNDAELYDSRAETSSSLAALMTAARSGHSATALSSGRVLIAGGASASASPGAPSAEIYTP